MCRGSPHCGCQTHLEVAEDDCLAVLHLLDGDKLDEAGDDLPRLLLAHVDLLDVEAEISGKPKRHVTEIDT